MKQKLISLFGAMQLFVFLQAQPVIEHGALQVKGTRLIDQNGKPVALHGMSFGWSCFHPRFYTAGTVHTLVHDWHCSVVRAALGIELEGGYKQDSAKNVQHVLDVVDAAIKENVYVIVDWHSHNINLQEAKRFFSMLAARYGTYPHLIYEVFNEPDEESWPDVKAYCTEVIREIRRFDPDNIILVGSPSWDQSIHLPAADPITGFSNLMYTMHFYAATHEKWLRDRTEAAIQNGLPVFISECAAMESSGDGLLNPVAWKEYVDWMDRLGLSWIGYSVSDKVETCSVLVPGADSDGRWPENVIKPWGQLARTYLRKY